MGNISFPLSPDQLNAENVIRLELFTQAAEKFFGQAARVLVVANSDKFHFWQLIRLKWDSSKLSNMAAAFQVAAEKLFETDDVHFFASIRLAGVSALALANSIDFTTDKDDVRNEIEMLFDTIKGVGQDFSAATQKIFGEQRN